MTTGFAEQGAREYAPRSRKAWSYVSGRVTALEAGLLARPFFDALLASEDISAARVQLGKTPYRSAFSSDDAVRSYPQTVAAYHDAAAAQVLADAPPHVMKRLLSVVERYRTMRSIFLRKSAFGESPDELEDAFRILAPRRDEREALSTHISMLRDREAPQSAGAVEQSLFLDSCASTVELALAGKVREKAVREVFTDIAVMRAWAAVSRSRWQGARPETIVRWFVVPEEYRPLVAASAELAAAEPADAVRGYLTRLSASVVEAAGSEAIRQDIDAVSGDALRESVLALRAVAFGPEKILAYLLALETEAVNIRVALAAVVAGIDRSRAAGRLRREYV